MEHLSFPIFSKVVEIRITRMSSDYVISIVLNMGDNDHASSTCDQRFDTYEEALMYGRGLKSGLDWQARLLVANIKNSQQHHDINTDDLIKLIEEEFYDAPEPH